MYFISEGMNYLILQSIYKDCEFCNQTIYADRWRKCGAVKWNESEWSKTHTRELQSETLLAGKEVSCKLQTDRVKGAVKVWRKCRATQLSQEHTSVLRPIPDPQNIMHLFCVKDQEMQPVELHKQT